MIKRLYILLLAIPFLFSLVKAQETFPQNGVYDTRDGHFAFINATIYKSYNEKLENATLVIREGKVMAIGKGIRLPQDLVTIDLKGKYIYPSFIDLYAEYGIPKSPKNEHKGNWQRQQLLSDKEGAYSWNESLKTDFNAYQHFSPNPKEAKAYREIGFGTLLTHRMDGISRGSASIVTLSNDRPHKNIIKESAAHFMSFNKGTSSQNYPGSLMGAIALLRQTYLDGMWYKNHGYKEETNISLASWNQLQDLPQVFAVGNKLEALRAHKIAQEFNTNYIFKGKGDEYQRIAELKSAGVSFIIPVNYPIAYDVEDPFDAMQIQLKTLKHWELAPSNPARLANAGINFAFTTHGLKNKSDFLKNVRKAVTYGLSEEAALKALIHTPAKMVKAYDMVGSLEKGKWANFIITSGNVFNKKTKIHHNWVQGKAHIISDIDIKDLSGVYQLKVDKQSYVLHVQPPSEDSKMLIKVNDSTNIKVKHSLTNELISLSFKSSSDATSLINLSGAIQNKEWNGQGTLADGSWVKWSATRTGDIPIQKEEKKKDKKEEISLGDITYPFTAFGQTTTPKAKDILIKNATIWTNEKEGILKKADVLVQNGKVTKVGKNITAEGVNYIDATGKHVTCGIIDEHSHIAISRGVNECTQSSTAEVRIGDVIDSDDIDIYRQLAGGVTTSQLLHGSCNPIGGQSAIIKLRWGQSPEKMKFENADGFIKFALGENVKRSRASSNIRFPDTRMGVEQVYVDAFTRAKEYEKKKALGGSSFRKDLDMEALVEILNQKRFITCHSYVQSEINMLMHVADDMGFKVNTFTHILEGYKVADKMKAHGAGGSSFSDWWAYKYEVIDAIPHNGAIMHRQGVTTAFNSDDAEMARRLNQEAAKAVMYGDVSEEDAWKFVTLNPAKLLHIDNRVGSIKAGKDADIVIWSDNPLSIYAKAEMTFIDGIKYFDRAEDQQRQLDVQKERARLIQKMIAEKNGGQPTQAVKKWKRHRYHCDDDHDEMTNHHH